MNFKVAFTQVGGMVLTAIASKFSLQGNGGKTRTLAAPVTPPTVAFTEPACAPHRWPR